MGLCCLSAGELSAILRGFLYDQSGKRKDPPPIEMTSVVKLTSEICVTIVLDVVLIYHLY